MYDRGSLLTFQRSWRSIPADSGTAADFYLERKMDQQEETETECAAIAPAFTLKVRWNELRFPLPMIDPLLPPFPPV